MEKELVEKPPPWSKFNRGSKQPIKNVVKKRKRLSPDQYADMVIREVEFLEDYFSRDKYE